MKDTMSYFQEAYDIAFNAGMEDERTRIIKALEGLKVEALMHPMQVLDKERVHQLDNYGAGFDSALDQAIKAVEEKE